MKCHLIFTSFEIGIDVAYFDPSEQRDCHLLGLDGNLHVMRELDAKLYAMGDNRQCGEMESDPSGHHEACNIRVNFQSWNVEEGHFVVYVVELLEDATQIASENVCCGFELK